jgi:hypothetical protein
MALFVDFQLLPFAAFGGVVHLSEVTVKRADRRLVQIGKLDGSLRLLYPALRWLVAPEAIIDLASS